MDTARRLKVVPSSPGGLRFLVLGRLEAYDDDDVELDLGPRKQRAVLALLLLNANHVVSTERLIDDLWGDSPPSTARAALQVYVAGLRKALGNGGASLRTRAPGYVLELDAGVLDLDRFTQLRAEARESSDAERRAALLHEALLLWRDEPLPELRTEPFSTAAVAQLDQLRLATLEERIDADLALGREAALVTELEALVAEHPYRERLRAQLMLALYRSGRQADALDAYQAGRRVLQDDLGLEPGNELRDLEAAILRHEEALSPALPVPAAEPDQPPSAAPPPRRRRRLAFGVVLALLVVPGVTAAALLLRTEPAPVVVPPNSVAVIDVDTNRVENSIPVGTRPGPVAAGAGFIWVGNLDDRSLSRIDPDTDDEVEVGLDATPDAVTVGGGAVWVVNGRLSTLYRVDPGSRQLSDPISLSTRSLGYVGAGVDVGEGSVWAALGNTLAQVHPVTLAPKTEPSAGGATALVVAYGWIWVATAGAEVLQFSPETYVAPVQTLTMGRGPSGIAAGADAIWVACREDDVVERIPADLNFGSSTQTEVGDGPTAVAFGAGAVWVANADDGTVSRIDPETYDVVKTIDVGNAPTGIAVFRGRVWVSVQAPLFTS